MRIFRSLYFVKLENLSNFKMKIEQINSIELKFDSTITLILLITTRQSTKYLFFYYKTL